MNVRIIRADTGEVSLNMRKYKALKKSEEGLGRNQHRKEYSIKGLFNLVRTPGIEAELSEDIEADLRVYEESRMQ